MYTAEGRVAGWLAPPGSVVEAGQPLVDISTEKANYELEAPAAGRFHPVIEIGSVLQVEGLIALLLEAHEDVDQAVAAARVASGAASAAPAQNGGESAPVPAADGGNRERSRVSPLARRLAAELGVELTKVSGSGPGGRIVEADVRAAAGRVDPAASPATGAPGAPGVAVPGLPWRVRERLPFSGDRRTIAERLQRSRSTAVALTLTREVAAGALFAARRRLAERLGTEVPWDALFVRLLGEALRERGELNAVIVGDEILRLDEVHVAFAVSLEGSLVAPVVRDADRRPIAEIARDVRELVARARAGKLSPADLIGGTATITNLGGHGVDAFTPVLNPPQSAILGVGRIVERAVVVGGALAIAHTCVLSLTFDHRVADGAPAAELLAAVARRMADPAWPAALAP